MTVQDTTPPDIVPPDDVVYQAQQPGGDNVTFPEATATDLVTANPSITYNPANGSFFPNGDTTVTVTAIDDAGNQSTATFKVTVLVDNPPTIRLDRPVDGETFTDANVTFTGILTSDEGPENTDVSIVVNGATVATQKGNARISGTYTKLFNGILT